FISFKRKNKAICSEFYEHYFIADHHARELRKYISSSARSDGLLNLNKKDFFKILVPYPTADKQKAIANALSTTREEIELLKRLAEKYKEQKRGLMQKLLTGNIRVKTD
ncbi:MAG TPA: restriction endonuclease subunit S, partial [Nitrospirae bacterium]|nr:restriction endonuclease subunit S [Nitrospirota bacterium]